MGISGRNHLLGPMFFEHNVTLQDYLDILNDVVAPELTQHYGQQANGAIRRVWVIQDGATIHRAQIVQDRLHQLFPRRVVDLGYDVEWPPRSPDLTPYDFY